MPLLGPASFPASAAAMVSPVLLEDFLASTLSDIQSVLILFPSRRCVSKHLRGDVQLTFARMLGAYCIICFLGSSFAATSCSVGSSLHMFFMRS
jgi:hypothetical protein